MSIKSIFYFLILFNILLMEKIPIYELQKYGEHIHNGETYYYLNVEDFEIGDNIYIELLFQELFSSMTHYNELLGSKQSDDLDFHFSYTNYYRSEISTIVETSSTFYFTIKLYKKSKYLLLATYYSLDKMSYYLIRHINFILHELPQFTEKILNGESYLFLNLTDFKLGDIVYLEISFKNSIALRKMPLGIYQSDNNTFFSLQNLNFIYSNNYHNTSLKKYIFDFKINLTQNSKYLIICTPNLMDMMHEDVIINHTKGKNTNILLYILILLFIIIVVVIIIIYRRRKKNKIEETPYYLKLDKPNETQNEPPPPFATPNDSPKPVNYTATPY